MDVAEESFRRQLSQAIEQDPPDFDLLCSLAADFVISKDACERLANLARDDEGRSTLRVAGFLEVVASQLEPTTNVDIARQALRFIGNACIDDDASKQIMLRPPLIGHVAYFLQLNSVAQIALGCITNMFMDSQYDDNALSETLMCSAISQGVHKILCRRLLYHLKTWQSRNYQGYAFELLSLLERLCPVSRHSELCRCNHLDVDFYTDLMQGAINCIPDKLFLSHDDAGYLEAPTSTYTDRARAIAAIGPDDVPEYHEIERGFDDMYPVLIDFLNKAQCITFAAEHGMIKELLPLYEAVAAYCHGLHPSITDAKGEARSIHLNQYLTKLQILILDIQEGVKYESPTVLRSDRLFMLYLAGLRHEHESVIELSALLLANIANSNDLAVAMAEEHGLVREALRTLFLAKSDKTLFAVYGLTRQLSIPISNAILFVQCSMLYVITPGQAAKVADHKAELMAWRAIRLVCRGIDGSGVSGRCVGRLTDNDWLPAIEARWGLLGNDLYSASRMKTTLDEIRTEIARIVISLLRFANKVSTTPAKIFQPEIYSNLSIMIQYLAQQGAMPKLAAEGWFGLGLLASFSWPNAQHVYAILKPDLSWAAFRSIATSASDDALVSDSQRQIIDPENTMRDGDLVSRVSVDERGKNIALNQQAANARWLANHLVVKLGEEMSSEHREDVRQWLRLTSKASTMSLEDHSMTSDKTSS